MALALAPLAVHTRGGAGSGGSDGGGGEDTDDDGEEEVRVLNVLLRLSPSDTRAAAAVAVAAALLGDGPAVPRSPTTSRGGEGGGDTVGGSDGSDSSGGSGNGTLGISSIGSSIVIGGGLSGQVNDLDGRRLAAAVEAATAAHGSGGECWDEHKIEAAADASADIAVKGEKKTDACQNDGGDGEDDEDDEDDLFVGGTVPSDGALAACGAQARRRAVNTQCSC